MIILYIIFSISSGDSGYVAFCAFLTTEENSPSLHHTFVFNYVKTNLGSAYNSHSGLFTAPTGGTYVCMIVNSEEVNGVHSGTKVVVVNLTCGDVVYVRTHPTTISKGNIRSDTIHGQPTFCGWKL